MPRTLPDGSRNAYRSVRLKDKLGSKPMPSGEIVFDGAVAYQLGALDRDMKQMLEMDNPSPCLPPRACRRHCGAASTRRYRWHAILPVENARMGDEFTRRSHPA